MALAWASAIMAAPPSGNRERPRIVGHAFVAACMLTFALLGPHAPTGSLVGGMALAGAVVWLCVSYRGESRDD